MQKSQVEATQILFQICVYLSYLAHQFNLTAKGSSAKTCLPSRWQISVLLFFSLSLAMKNLLLLPIKLFLLCALCDLCG